MNLGPLDERVITLFDSGGAVAVAIVVAVAAGSLHALAPGHGKSLTAAYLIGRGGRSRDAAALGLVVAAMHTVSVGVLALSWYLLVDVVAVELGRVTAVLQLAAALLAVGLGLGMLARNSRRHPHHHPRGHNGHHAHVQADSGMVPWSRPSLIALGLSGGLVPSPSAFLVLISGLLAGRLSVAVVLVASFAIGMAATLSLVGVAALRGLDLIDAVVARRPGLGRVARALPVAAAVGVLVSGSVLAVRAADVLVRG